MELKVKQMQRVDGFKESLYLPALFMGFRLTVRHFFRNLFGSKDVVTVQYPEEHLRRDHSCAKIVTACFFYFSFTAYILSD